MKSKLLLVSLALCAALPLASHAQQRRAAPVPHWYAGIHGGVNDVKDWSADVNFGGPTTAGELRLDRGLHFGLMAGRRTENARFEVEYQHGRMDIDRMTLGGFSQAASGKGSYDALTVNAYRTFEVANRTTAYIGAGIGWGRVKLPTLPTISGCNCFRGVSDDGLVYQLRLGAEYEIQNNQHLLAQYTLLHVPGLGSGGAPSVEYSSKNINIFSIGYRAGF
ncbi:outer membrane protein [Ramlibacter sp.]|uniref:outer membrane protein n=1 Tax=Ramlibacter sp. TaxID=1917967 RepID=UPI003D132812